MAATLQEKNSIHEPQSFPNPGLAKRPEKGTKKRDNFTQTTVCQIPEGKTKDENPSARLTQNADSRKQGKKERKNRQKP